MTTKLSPFSTLLATTIAFIKQHFTNLLLLVGLGFSINLSISTTLAALIGSSTVINSIFTHPTENITLLLAAVVVALGTIAAMIYIQSWSWVAVISYIKGSFEGKTLRLSDVIKSTRPLAGKYMAISLATTCLYTLGYTLFVVPGIIFSLWFAFAGFILIEEGLTGTTALIRSKFYVSLYTWQVFTRIFTLGLLTIIITFTSAAISNVPILGAFTYYLIQAILLIAGVVFNFHLYQELKSIKTKEKLALDKISKTPYKIGYLLGAVLLIFLLAGFTLITADIIKNPPITTTPTPQVTPSISPTIPAKTSPTPAKSKR